jgi:Transglutaminase-like superfamily
MPLAIALPFPAIPKFSGHRPVPGLLVWSVVCATWFCSGFSVAQEPAPGQETSTGVVKESRHVVRVGARIQAAGRPVSGVVVTMQVPTEWPEQHVSLYQENLPSEVERSTYRDTDTIRQFIGTIPRLPAQSGLEIEILFDVTVKGIPYPERTDHLVIPEKPAAEIRQWLSPGLMIESRKPKVRKQAEAATGDFVQPWEKCRAIHQWVINNITIRDGKEAGAEEAIDKKTGSVEDRSFAFIAMCRSLKIPARMVWADRGEYAEFYLEDGAGGGNWYPAVLDAKPEFGKLTDPRVILQKGENIKLPENSKPVLYVVETIAGKGQMLPPVWICDVLQGRDVR